MYALVYRKSVVKSLTKLPNDVCGKFTAAFQQLASGDSAQFNIKKLSGRDGFRLRIGGYRAIYRIHNDQLIIEVLAVGSRGDIYK